MDYLKARLKKLTFENIDFTYAKDAKPGVAAMMLGCDEAVKQGLIINNAKELILKNVNITGCEGEPVVTGNVDTNYKISGEKNEFTCT